MHQGMPSPWFIFPFMRIVRPPNEIMTPGKIINNTTLFVNFVLSLFAHLLTLE
jgi:hypothetical protein